MDRSRCCKRLSGAAATVMLLLTACNSWYGGYSGTALTGDHHWLKDKKIFIDPGHGGGDPRDRFRTGPNGVAEPEINLQVAKILVEMLKTAGASVELSRTGSSGPSDHERARMARQWGPDLLVSIHHAGSLRNADMVNYPAVMIWGGREVQPASYDCALHLIDEFNAISNEKGIIVSDFSLFSEIGSTMLRETRHCCPGIIGEAGFYSDRKHSIRLKEKLYLEKEAEAYFRAISRYFKWGLPTAEVRFSCPVDNNGYEVNAIQRDTPQVTIRTFSGNELAGINEQSLHITLDGIAVGHRRLSENLYAVDYGPVLYPGFHRLKFQFKNLRNQSSMVLNAPFTLDAHHGDYCRLVSEGTKLIRQRRKVREGLKMLLAALSLGYANPDNEKIILDIARGFAIIGDKINAELYVKKRAMLYPVKSFSENRASSRAQNIFLIPADYFGKQVPVVGATRCRENCGQ